MSLDPNQVKSIVESVLSRLAQGSALAPSVPATPAVAPAACGCSRGTAPGQHGIFSSVEQAAEAAQDAFLQLKKQGVAGRAKVIEIVKGLAVANAEPWGRFEMDETKIGRVDHKIGKLLLSLIHI